MAMLALIVLMAAGVIAFGVWLFHWQYRSAESKLNHWAQRSNYQVLYKREANPLGTGPKVKGASNKQVMYRVVISDENGVRRSALIKIGSPALGVLANDLVVEWES
jgi:hypothetical protein